LFRATFSAAAPSERSAAMFASHCSIEASIAFVTACKGVFVPPMSPPSVPVLATVTMTWLPALPFAAISRARRILL
jgi:hypothetical protein